MDLCVESVSEVKRRLNDLLSYEYIFKDENLRTPIVFYSLVEWYSIVMFPNFENAARTLDRLQRVCTKVRETCNEEELADLQPLIGLALKRVAQLNDMSERMKEAGALFVKAQRLSHRWSDELEVINGDLKKIRRCLRSALSEMEMMEEEDT
jgi:hypothetical protein